MPKLNDINKQENVMTLTHNVITVNLKNIKNL